MVMSPRAERLLKERVDCLMLAQQLKKKNVEKSQLDLIEVECRRKA